MLNLLDYSHLPIGHTANGECPTCGKRKFYVTRTVAGYAFICFRASCGTQGFAGGAALAPSGMPHLQERAKWKRQYTGELFPVEDEDVDYFYDRFGVELETPERAAYYVKKTSDDRYAFVLRGPQDEFRGVMLRRPNWSPDVGDLSIKCPRPDRVQGRGDGDYPKAIAYFDDSATGRAAWYASTHEDTVVIVEDCVSAMRIMAEGYSSMALLGTHFMPEHIRDMQKFSKRARYILALDPDATGKALEIVRKWGHAVPGTMEVAILARDPKDYAHSDQLLRDLRI